MNIRDLKYLIALVEHRHFGKAAKSCFVSQPALSIQIKKLEAHLGVKLLERNNKSVMLTDIGEHLGRRAQLIINQVEEMQTVAKQAMDPYSGDIKLGLFPTLGPYLLPHIIPRLSAAFPRLSLYLIEEQTHLLLNKLNEGKIDAALLALPITDKGLVVEPLFEEDFLLAVPQRHSFTKRKIIKHAELEEESLLLLDEGHCLREQALSFCQKVNAGETLGFRATSLETLRHMVAAGVGMTLIPELARKENDGVAYLAFASPKPKRSVGIVWRATSSKERVIKDISKLIRQSFPIVR